MKNAVTNRFQRGIGLFRSHSEAEQALIALSESNFDMNRVSVVSKKSDPETLENISTSANTARDKTHNNAGSEAAKGATVGGIGGGALGLLAGFAVLAIPGVGPVAEVATVLANTVLGGAIGAAGGGLVGALVGWGVSEDRAEHYHDRVYSEGDYLLLIEGDALTVERAETILRRYNIHDWHTFDSSDVVTESRRSDVPMSSTY